MTNDYFCVDKGVFAWRVLFVLLFLCHFNNAIAGSWEDGKAAFERGDYRALIQIRMPEAFAGNASAQYHVGLAYKHLEEYQKAARWYRKAADQGNAYAQGQLAYLYEKGNGVRQDYSEAAKWYRKAADQGNEWAKSQLVRVEKQVASSSNHAENPMVWCAKNTGVTYELRRACVGGEGSWHLHKHYAEKEHKRLKSLSVESGEASSIYDPMVWCANNTGVTYERRGSCMETGGTMYANKFSAEAESHRLKLNEGSSSSATAMLWCGTSEGVFWLNRAGCREKGGKAYKSVGDAKAEHRRLKSVPSSGSSSRATSTSSKKSKYNPMIWCVRSDRVTNERFQRCIANGGLGYSKRSDAENIWRQQFDRSSSATAMLWCGTSEGVFWLNRAGCREKGGKAYKSVGDAKAEHRRLKSVPSSGSSSSSTPMVWCARLEGVKYEGRQGCTTSGGNWFVTRPDADKERRRLVSIEEKKVKTATLMIRSNVRGDRVYVDGDFKGATPLTLDLPKGSYTVRITKQGYERYKRTVKLIDETTLQATLKKVVVAAERPITSVVEKNNLDIAHWKKIKGSEDPEDYQVYLSTFPQGVYKIQARKRLGILISQIRSIDLPECERKEVEDYWENRSERSFEAVKDHVLRAKLVSEKYEEHADLACFTHLYMSLDIESDGDRGRRFQRIKALGGKGVYQSVVAEAKIADRFIYDNYYQRGLCVIKQLAGFQHFGASCGAHDEGEPQVPTGKLSPPLLGKQKVKVKEKNRIKHEDGDVVPVITKEESNDDRDEEVNDTISDTASDKLQKRLPPHITPSMYVYCIESDRVYQRGEMPDQMLASTCFERGGYSEQNWPGASLLMIMGVKQPSAMDEQNTSR